MPGSVSNEFLKKVARSIRVHGLFADAKPVIVAVSGGADSVALLLALHRLGYECVAAHCNYHLRGEESNRDMRSVQALCARIGLDLYVRDMDVDRRRRDTGESVEMACRALRYDWFADLLDRLRAQAIAVAHHREDNVETFFLNLVRGSGITGLAGMRWRNGYVVRPLLDLSRGDIEAFLADQGVDFVVDSTNARNDYARNRWRNVIIPMIEEQFPGSVSGIVESIRHLSENRDFYDARMDALRSRYVSDRPDGGFDVDLKQLVDDKPMARLVLHYLIRGKGFNFTHVDNIIGCASKSGMQFRSADTLVDIDHGIMHVVPADVAALSAEAGTGHRVSLARDILAPAHILVSEHAVSEFVPERDPNVAYFDISIMGGDATFALRHWQRGDRMTPYGMTGSKLVSDIFASAKLGAAQKRDAWLLVRNGEIVWVVGLRAGASFSVSPGTRRYLRLQFRP